MSHSKTWLGFILLIGFGILQASQEAPEGNPVARIKELLTLFSRGLQNELCGRAASVNYRAVFAECNQNLDLLERIIHEYCHPDELGHDIANTSRELHSLFDLLQAKLGIIELQMAQLPIVKQGDRITCARRQMLVAKVLKKIQEVQNSLHTLFNIMNNQPYRLLPGVDAAEGDRVVAKEVRKQLPVSLFGSFWRGVMGYFSPAAAEPADRPQIMPEPVRPLVSGITDQVATALDNTYSDAIIDKAQKITEQALRVAANTEPCAVKSVDAQIQQQVQWLSYDLAGRLRSYGFGHHNYMPMLADEFAQKMGVKKKSMTTLEMLGDGTIPLNRPWLLKLGISRTALFAMRRFESLMVAAAQPKPASILSKLKWWVSRGCYGLIRFCAGKSNMQWLEGHMVGSVFDAPPSADAVIPFTERKHAPQMKVNEWGRELSVSVDGTDDSMVVAIKKGSQKAFIEACNAAGDNLALFDNAHGLRLKNVLKPDGSNEISIAGEFCPLVRVEPAVGGPVVSILSAAGRQLKVCQQGSIASYIASVRKFRESPVNKILCDELFYRVGAHADFIRENSQRLHRTMKSLDGRELTALEENVENTDLRGRLQGWATQWHRP